MAVNFPDTPTVGQQFIRYTFDGEKWQNTATYVPLTPLAPIAVVATQSNIFGMARSDPTQYLIPGNGAPAVSTSSYFNLFGMYNMRPYDLDTMGSAGAALKTAHGGRRYVWLCSADHPNFNYGWRGQSGFSVGFSHQPWDLPRQMDEFIPPFNSWADPTHAATGLATYEFPLLFYNPDDVEGKVFYIYAETGPSNWTGLWRSSDFITWTPKVLSHYHIPGTDFAFSSFQTYVKRNGPGDFVSIGWGTGAAYSRWTSTDANTFTSSAVPIFGGPNVPDAAGIVHMYSGIFTVGSQMFAVGKEEHSPIVSNTQQGSIIPINPVTFDKLSSPAKFVFTSTYDNNGFPGPTFINGSPAYDEDGIVYTYFNFGFPSDVNNANSEGHGGKPYTGPNIHSGGLDQQFIDITAIRVDSTVARQSAPVGVAVSCASGVVTISWKNALPQQTYRVYRSPNNITWTLVGDVTGISTTDSPVAGRYWYKVVTLDGGVERKNRVLSVYVSNSDVRVNEHIDRVLEDGGDFATINIPLLRRMVAMLDTAGVWNALELFTHPGFGSKVSGGLLKIYDLGTTRLPRSEDFKATTTGTTYSVAGLNGGPCWVNANNTAYGYWGNPKRGNTIHRKRQITLLAAYERTQTSEDVTFLGTGPIWGNTNDGNKIIALKHTAAGNIEFSLSDETGVSVTPGPPPARVAGTAATKTAIVAASGTGLKIAAGTYDGTSMKAWTGTTSGTAVTTLNPNPDFGLTDGTWVEGSLAGSRNNSGNGSAADVVSVAGFGYKQIYPFLGSGAVHCYVLRAQGAVDDRKFIETNAKFNVQCMMVLETGVNATQMATIVSALQSTTDWAAGTGFTVDLVGDFGGVGDDVVDNSPMLASFNAYAIPKTAAVTLTIPAGTFKLGGAGGPPAQFFTKGVETVNVLGIAGTSLHVLSSASPPRIGGFGQYGNNLHDCRIATVSAGATQVTLLTPAQASRFTPGTWAYVSGIDLQGIVNGNYGFPTNQHFFDYVKIVSVNTSTGVVVLDRALTDSYKSTWAIQYDGVTGGGVPQGGAAWLFGLDPTWDTDAYANGITFTLPNASTPYFYGVGRNVTWENCVFTGTSGPCPSQNLITTYKNCDLTNAIVEVDKMIDTLVIDGCTHLVGGNAKWFFQSSSVKTLTVTNSHLHWLTGTARNTSIDNSTIDKLWMGAASYGVSRSCTVTNSTVSEFSISGAVVPVAGLVMTAGVIKMVRIVTILNAVDNGAGKFRLTVDDTTYLGVNQQLNPTGAFTASLGPATILAVDNANSTIDINYTLVGASWTGGGTLNASAPTWAIPGYWVQMNSSINGVGVLGVFKVLDQWNDADYIYVSTTLPGTWPATTTSVQGHPCSIWNGSNNTGCLEILDHNAAGAQGKPIYSYVNRTYDKTLTTTAALLPKAIGTIVSIKINVVTPYTGAQSVLKFHLSAFDNWTVRRANETTYTMNIQINAKIAGLRTFVPGLNTGMQSGDVATFGAGISVITAGDRFGGPSFSGPNMSANVSAETAGPVINVEIITDQGIS